MTTASDVLTDVTTGILFRNPSPHVRSIHAYFPSVARHRGRELLATLVLAEAFEAVNGRVHWARSADGGRSWESRGAFGAGPATELTSESGRITVVSDNHLVVLLQQSDRRQHPNEGLTNPATLGFVPTSFSIVESFDAGKTWGRPRRVEPPLEGPNFEICSSIKVLRDGRWLLPTSTWSGWNGELPNGNRMVAFVSEDAGRTWPTYLDIMSSPQNTQCFWESKIVELPDGGLLVPAWVYDKQAKADLPNQYTLSRDGGRTWLPLQSTRLEGQTLTPHLLEDGRVVCVYRRMDRSGLWAQVVRIQGDRWVNEGTQPLWGHGETGLTATTGSMAHNFHVLRFGAPSITSVGQNEVFVAFWCYEDCVSVIRWFRFQVA